MLKFGDIIEHDSFLYIFLAQKNDNYTYYFAKIISDDEIIEKMISKKETYKPSPTNPAKEQRLLLITCFTILTTEDFIDDLAFLGNPDSHGINISEHTRVIGSLNGDDLEDIKNEILENIHVLPRTLVHAIQQLNE